MAACAEPADVRLPLRICEMTRERLERVSVLARRVGQVAAFLGRTFSFDHVAAMLDVSPAFLLGPIEELVRAELVADDGDSLTFPNEVLRQAVLETLPRAAWPALQRQAIVVLLEAGASPVEPATLLAKHARVGDRSTATLALSVATSRVAYMGGAFQDALRQVDQPRRSGQREPDHRMVIAEQWRAEILVVLDQFDVVQNAVVDGVAAAHDGLPAWAERSWQQLHGRWLFQTGRIDEAAATLDAVRPPNDAPAVSNAADAAALRARGQIAIHTGDGRGARTRATLAESALERGTPEVRRQVALFLALHALVQRDPVSARARLAELEKNDAISPLPLLMVDITDPALLVRMALAAGDDDLAHSAVATAERRGSLNPDVPSIAATAAHARGLLARDLGALADACRLFSDGPRPLARALAHEDYGVELVRQSDRERGINEFVQALRIYSSTGATWDAARIRGRLRELGVRYRLVKSVRPTRGWAGLTNSELAVARLVAEGLKNREVAERLFVSRHTVSMHLRNAFTKLNINSRVELTRHVFENERAA